MNKPSEILNEYKWYVFYTHPRAEKVVYQDLLRRGYEVFLPFKKTVKEWKNRQKKIIDQILFPGYIFVYTTLDQVHSIERLSKVACYVHIERKPCVLPNKEVDCLKMMLELDQTLSIELDFHQGEAVRVISGPLAGYEGLLVEKKGEKRFCIQLKDINQSVLIDINTSMFVKIN